MKRVISMGNCLRVCFLVLAILSNSIIAAPVTTLPFSHIEAQAGDITSIERYIIDDSNIDDPISLDSNSFSGNAVSQVDGLWNSGSSRSIEITGYGSVSSQDNLLSTLFVDWRFEVNKDVKLIVKSNSEYTELGGDVKAALTVSLQDVTTSSQIVLHHSFDFQSGSFLASDNFDIQLNSGHKYKLSFGSQLLTFAATSLGSRQDYFSVNISPIPIPATVWLFGSGLIGLIGIARRKKS